MPTSIGLYVHRLQVFERGSATPTNLSAIHGHDVYEIVRSYIDRVRSTPEGSDERQRSFRFEPQPHNQQRTFHGVTSYGIYGFESEFRDSRTGEETYQRQVTDQEEVPLYYQFWLPSDQKFGLIVLQSFGFRSCVQLIHEGVRNAIREAAGKVRVDFDRLMPSQTFDSFANAEVRQVRLISRRMHGSKAQRYVRANAEGPDEALGTVELVLSAERRRRFGTLRELQQRYHGAPDELLAMDDIQFDEALAEIEVNGRP